MHTQQQLFMSDKEVRDTTPQARVTMVQGKEGGREGWMDGERGGEGGRVVAYYSTSVSMVINASSSGPGLT